MIARGAHTTRLGRALTGTAGIAALVSLGAASAADAITRTRAALTTGLATSPDDIVAAATGAGAAAVCTWLVIGAIASATAILRHRPRPTWVPGAWHRIVALTLGAGMVLAPAATPHRAGQDSLDPGWPNQLPTLTQPAAHQPSTTQAAAVQPAPEPAEMPLVPGWHPGTPHPTPSTRPAPDTLLLPHRTTPEDHLVVRRGDTLWDLAARHLGTDASDAEIALEWPRWHQANAAVIGHNPDLLLPGQILRPPPPHH